jgi:DNA transposition AAA+ family ATPase
MEKLNREHKQMITDAINNWIDPKNPERSQNKLAEGSRVNVAYISAIKNGDYSTNAGGRDAQISDAHFNRLADFLDVKFEGGFYWTFIKNTTRIDRLCRKTQRKAITSILDGPTGQSKTFTLEKYSKRNYSVVYVKLTQNMTANNLVDDILEKLNVHAPIRGIHEKLKAINKVVVKGGYLIIFDEAEVVKPGIYAVIKDVSDSVKNKAGLVVCGFGLINKLEKLANKEKAGFPQLRRRLFGNIEVLGKVTENEIVEICLYEGITNKGAQNLIVHNCEDLDKLAQWIDDIKQWQKAEGRKISGEEVARMFGIRGLNMKAA